MTQYISNAQPIEQLILDEISSVTGLTFRKLGGIDSRSKSIAEAVLPVLARWPERLQDATYRQAVYSRFLTPFAHPYLEMVLAWWIREEDSLASGCITQVLTIAAKCRDAQRIWTLYRGLPHKPFHYMLMAKLSTCRSVQREVCDSILNSLLLQDFYPGDLAYVAKISDQRIQDWLKKQQLGRLPLARRGFAKQKLPRVVAYADSSPNRQHEAYSTEVDLTGLGDALISLTNRFEFTISSILHDGTFLSGVELDRWVVTRTKSTSGLQLSIWFRLEDIDTVEIVVLREPSN